jgi:hypothetical protein
MWGNRGHFMNKLNFIDFIYGLGILAMITGAFLNMLNLRIGFLFWICSNIIFEYRSYKQNDMFWGIVFQIMLFTSVFGWFYWGGF